MEYVVSLKTAQNDVKALLNLEPERKRRVVPFMHVRGKDDKQLTAFLDGWGSTPFLMDISRYGPDQKDAFIVEGRLHESNNAYAAKRDFFELVQQRNAAIVPVVSWAAGDSTRDLVQCAVQLEQKFSQAAIKVDMRMQDQEIDKLSRILDAVRDPAKFFVILDFGHSGWPDLSSTAPLYRLLAVLKPYRIANAILLSTSFPDDKPASGSSRAVECTDYSWQSVVRLLDSEISTIYGDYGATNPNSAVEYVPGMPVIPFATYFANSVWTQYRLGRDKEFSVYPSIAQAIRAQPGYHSDNFCWANREIARIAKANDGKYGNNGTWNGYRINQHICAILHDMDNAGSLTPVPEDDDLDP